MQIRFFAIPALDPGAAEAELNAVLAAGRRFVSDRLASLPAFTLPR